MSKTIVRALRFAFEGVLAAAAADDAVWNKNNAWPEGVTVAVDLPATWELK